MKSILRITAVLIVLQLMSCSDNGHEKSEQDVMTNMLTASAWGHAQVTHSDGDLSDQYTNFMILFRNDKSDGFDGTFIISNGGYAFEEQAGHWRFSDDLNQIIFDSEKTIDLQLEEGHLQLDFTTAPSGGKVAGLSGHFIFDLQPL